MRYRTESIERGIRRLLVHRAFEFPTARTEFEVAVYNVRQERTKPQPILVEEIDRVAKELDLR